MSGFKRGIFIVLVASESDELAVGYGHYTKLYQVYKNCYRSLIICFYRVVGQLGIVLFIVLLSMNSVTIDDTVTGHVM